MVPDLGASASCFLGLRSRAVVSVLLSCTLVGPQEWGSSLAPPDLEPPLPLPQVLTDLAGAAARVLIGLLSQYCRCPKHRLQPHVAGC